MVMAATAEWTRAQDALRAEVNRVTALLRTVRQPTAAALGRWNVAEVAAHLAQVWGVLSGLASDDLSGRVEVPPELRSDDDGSFLAGLWELQEATVLGVQADPERDLAVIADRIDERARDFFAAMRGPTALDLRAWIVRGTKVRLTTLTCHLLNETMVHGYDIARAEGRRWAIDPSHATMVLEGFLFPVVQVLDPRSVVDQEAAAGVRVTYELHIRGGGRYVFAFDDGALTIEPSGSSRRRIDCHVSADPAALLLVAWARKSQWAAIARGQLVAWGRKPWLGPRLRWLIRNP